MKFNLSKSNGFTVLESMFAIFILSLAIGGTFTNIQQGLSQAILAKDEIRAYYLAQEGIEIIRNKRDVNQIAFIKNGSANGWMYGIAESGNPCQFGNVCRVSAEVTNFPLQYCGNTWGTCPNLNFNETTGLYTYDPAISTNFKREIMLEQISATEVMLTVRVTWSKGLISKEIKAKTHLFNWVI